MELGNMLMGHSRGKYPVNERYLYLEILEPLFAAMDTTSYGKHFSNDVFEMHPYCWCDESECPQCGLGTQVNFFHKQSGLKLNWYKYALRDSYTNVEINPEMFTDIVDDCMRSLGVGEDALKIHCPTILSGGTTNET